ncbi:MULTISPECIES: porphobilinogen synthase [unclassified Oceanispirochaeta]|uniref:porphobilinogen synthase n=1 Tax=unclassified Oceanispirochaeta TaxID=2635722 RepID=UPI000E09005E|nr:MULTISPECIES: porphobilinogen synthase [unclassified Oceanispirochaeta]MBF9016947.1 porphobilinogen synthase [Oceanispirochaeta sp. M2]NPD73310.1 porphobilinogen synthase [Oceanispirochaeta sp. M1]RDG30972.1 porphobilinogen synthase [Oceanispirochaeta sp. M1]
MSNYPQMRMRRLRKSESIRRLFDSPLPGPEKFVWPLFISEGEGVREEITSMEGQYRLSPDKLCREVESAAKAGIGSVLLFGLTDNDKKDACGSEAYREEGSIQKAITVLKKEFPDLPVMTDVCLCAYTDHGHCGPLDKEGNVDNDASLEHLKKIALSHARAGADIVAPSAMMDGQISAIRSALDCEHFSDISIMSYSTKFASAFYGPFRDAEKSAPGKGDRKGYQQSWADPRQALRESLMDEDEGADILMVKPALLYLDVIKTVRENSLLPLAAYNTSGEYAMLIASAEKGYGNLKDMVRESIGAINRAGADLIITYWASRYNDLFKD